MTHMDIVDMASDLLLKAEALRAVATEFSDDFTTARDPEDIAKAITHRPKVYVYLWYVIFDLISDIATKAEALDDAVDKAQFADYLQDELARQA